LQCGVFLHNPPSHRTSETSCKSCGLSFQAPNAYCPFPRKLVCIVPLGEADEETLHITGWDDDVSTSDVNRPTCEVKGFLGGLPSTFITDCSTPIARRSNLKVQIALHLFPPSISDADAADVGKTPKCKSSTLHGYLSVSMKTPKPFPLLPTKRRFNHETFPRLWCHQHLPETRNAAHEIQSSTHPSSPPGRA
jgi:hypothetical protein